MPESRLIDELRAWTEELRTIADEARATTPHVDATLRRAVDAAAAGDGAQPTIAIVGEVRAARRALIDSLLGGSVLAPGPSAGRDVRITWVRRASTYEYAAHSRDGRRVVRFSQRMPDRRELFDRQLAQAEAELDAARTTAEERRARLESARAQMRQTESAVESARLELDQVQGELTRAREALAAADEQWQRAEAAQRAVPPVPALLLAPPVWWAVWLWLLRVVVMPFWRGKLQLRAAAESEATRARDAAGARSTEAASAVERQGAVEERHRQQRDLLRAQREAVLALEQEAADTSAVERATARAERLRDERDKYAQERLDAFFEDLRVMGEEIAELTVEYPAAHLPEGMTLLDVPAARVGEAHGGAPEALRDAHGFVQVLDGEAPPGSAPPVFLDELARTAPQLLVVRAEGDRIVDPASAAGVASAFERLHAMRSLVVGLRAAMALRTILEPLSDARDAAEEAHQKRLSALEGQRIPEPAEFRERQMARAHASIEREAEEAVSSAAEELRASLARLRHDWTEQVATCTDRSTLRSVLENIDGTASARIGEVLEAAARHVASELQTATETIEAWALEEIQARYRLARRIGAEWASPIASELTREDLEVGPRSAPVEGAMEAFEKQRVSIGLGGVAAGAALGTLIAPGIGTAIGAFVGVFAGFFKGVESLQQDCLAKIDACIGEAERHALAQLEAKRPELSRALRETVEMALGEAFERLEQAISRLLDVERRALEAERTKLDALDDARTALLRIDVQLDQAVDDALRELSPPPEDEEEAPEAAHSQA